MNIKENCEHDFINTGSISRCCICGEYHEHLDTPSAYELEKLPPEWREGGNHG